LGLVGKEGKMVDASFVEAPRQRNSREENAQIKEGSVPENWKQHPAKLIHKDVDARWTKKNNENHYGYKNHVKAQTSTKLIEDYEVTNASVHDSQLLDRFVSKGDGSIHADSAYKSQEFDTMIQSREVANHICEKGYRNAPLTELQKQANRLKSKVRSRVEHIFGFMTNSMKALRVRCIGIRRTRCAVGLMNLVYNMARYEQIVRLELVKT
jgi:IS5 family transposase